MTSRANAVPKKLQRVESQLLAKPAVDARDELAARDLSEVLERADKLRGLLYESEKLCQWISSAVNTPALPAGTWIYVDVLRMNVLAGMRAAQLLQLKVRELVPELPAKAKE